MMLPPAIWCCRHCSGRLNVQAGSAVPYSEEHCQEHSTEHFDDYIEP
jgi:hypothetical protein